MKPETFSFLESAITCYKNGHPDLARDLLRIANTVEFSEEIYRNINDVRDTFISSEDRAYSYGWHDYQEGKMTNPYTRETERQSWEKGWDDCRIALLERTNNNVS